MNRESVLYPIYLDLRAHRVVMVGAGRVAERRLRRLLDSGAEIVVVAPQATRAIETWAEANRLRLERRPFRPADLDGARLAFIAAGDPALNVLVHDAARERGVLLNDAERAETADFHVPAVTRTGDVQVAVSTGGRDPSSAARLRDVLGEWLGSFDLDSTDSTSSRPRAQAEFDEGRIRAGRRRVAIVGAGPGDPGLLTVRALDRLERADIVYYDRLVGPAILDRIPARVEQVYVGKTVGDANRANIGDLLVASFREGQRVVRLKGGDPGLFGRVGEELLALARHGIDFEIVPGISALHGVPAAAGIPITYRELASEVVIRSGHAAPYPRVKSEGTTTETTWVYFMAVARLARIVEELRAEGVPGDMPVAVIERGTLPDQRVITASLAEIVERTEELRIEPPALVVIGEVVRFRNLAELDARHGETEGAHSSTGAPGNLHQPNPEMLETPWND